MLTPRDEADLAECIAGRSAPVEVLGQGSQRAIAGAVDAEPLSVAALDGVLSYEPAEMVLTARAGTPLAEITQLLASRGQRLAFDPPAAGAKTLGGVLATNLSGSRRVTAGAARDHFLGFRAVNGLGQVFVAGGKVVKNVTGFDLPKLLAGSWGTLAVLTEVTVRVVPAPERDLTVALGCASAARACELMSRALASTHEVSAAALDPAAGELLLRLEGFGASVDARERSLAATLGVTFDVRQEGEASAARWQALGAAAALADCGVLWRIALAASEAPDLLHALRAERWLLDFGGSRLWIGEERADERIRHALPRGAHALLWRAPAGETLPRFPPQTPAVATLNERIKAAFDPRGLLNPGRMR